MRRVSVDADGCVEESSVVGMAVRDDENALRIWRVKNTTARTELPWLYRLRSYDITPLIPYEAVFLTLTLPYVFTLCLCLLSSDLEHCSRAKLIVNMHSRHMHFAFCSHFLRFIPITVNAMCDAVIFIFGRSIAVLVLC